MKKGEFLAILRIANNMTKIELANKCNCSVAHMTNMEYGHKDISMKMYEKLSSIFKIKVSKILALQEEAIENEWDYKKTLYEILKEYEKDNLE